MNDMLKTRCKLCGKIIHTKHGMIEYHDRTAAHTVCVERQKNERTRPVRVNRRALSTLLSSIMDITMDSYED